MYSNAAFMWPPISHGRNPTSVRPADTSTSYSSSIGGPIISDGGSTLGRGRQKGAGGTSTQSIGIVKLTTHARHCVPVHEHDETCWRARVVSEQFCDWVVLMDAK